MIVLEGLPALSAFRRERLQSRLQLIAPDIGIAGAWHVYFVDENPNLGLDIAILGRILEGCPGRFESLSGAVSRFITPRLGTRSPWSSKATEILQGAQLPVHRVERGLRIDLIGAPEAGSPLWQDINKLLSDPMMQTVWSDIEQAKALFASPARGPLQRIAIRYPCRSQWRIGFSSERR